MNFNNYTTNHVNIGQSTDFSNFQYFTTMVSIYTPAFMTSELDLLHDSGIYIPVPNCSGIAGLCLVVLLSVTAEAGQEIFDPRLQT